jgi:hypothetical protein
MTSLPGTEVLRIVDRGSRDAQRFAERSGAEAEAAHAAVQAAIERRGRALLELARHYLPNLDEATIGRAFGEVRSELEALRGRRDSRLRELAAEVAAADAERARLEDEVTAVTRQLEAQVAARDERQRAAAARLAEDPEFQRLASEAARAELRLERDEARADEVEREAAEKLPAFEQSRLFRYLHERGFGTPEYRGRGIVRRIDRWVAGLVDYAQARASYDFLRSMPGLVDQEVARRRAEFDATMARIDATRAAVEQEVGLAEILARGDGLGARRDALVDALDAAHVAAAAARAAIVGIEDERGGFHAEALERLRAHLDRLANHELEAQARLTAETVDDHLVAEIAAATRELDAQRVRIEGIARIRQAAAERARALQDIVQRLRRSNFDSQRSRFAGIAAVDLERRMQRIAEGQESADGLWQDLSGRQAFEGPPVVAATGAVPARPVSARTAEAPRVGSGGGEFPWWLVQVLGAAVDIGLKAASGRGVLRHGGGSVRSSGGGRSSGAPGGGGRSGGGGFTRGAGF